MLRTQALIGNILLKVFSVPGAMPQFRVINSISCKFKNNRIIAVREGIRLKVGDAIRNKL